MKALIFLLLACWSACGAVSFNGSTAKLFRNTPGPDQGAPPMELQNVSRSFSFWLRIPNYNLTPIVCSVASADNYGYFLQVATNGALQYRFTDSSVGLPQTYSTSASAILSNTWTHVMFTFAPGNANSAKFYINDSLQSGSWTGVQSNNNSYVSLKWYMADDQVGTLGNFEITEYNVWFTHQLNTIQRKTVSSSRLKNIATQIQTLPQWTPNSKGICTILTLDDFADGVTMTGTNSVRSKLQLGPGDGGYYPMKATPLGSPVSRAETVCSYQPNE